MSREAMRRALDALEVLDRVMQRSERTNSAINALRAALAEPEREPVCDKDPRGCWNVRCQLGKVCKNTAPTPRKPLTDEEIDRQWVDEWDGFVSFVEAECIVRWTEQRHGITGEQT